MNEAAIATRLAIASAASGVIRAYQSVLETFYLYLRADDDLIKNTTVPLGTLMAPGFRYALFVHILQLARARVNFWCRRDTVEEALPISRAMISAAIDATLHCHER